jgi:murein DD-endopeptidase MepM/ murein hydrolase activator NlpD
MASRHALVLLPALVVPALVAMSAVVTAVGSAPTTRGGGGSGTDGTARRGSGYQAPVAGALVVLRPFEPPPGPYAAGHRGVDLAVGSDRVVRTARAGRVWFAGSVAGRGVVVVVHEDGVRTEYEPLIAAVRTGAGVAAGQHLGVVAGRHGNCIPNRCLHWGAQRDGEYFDPMTLLAPLGVVRLVPWAGPPSVRSRRARLDGFGRAQARG